MIHWWIVADLIGWNCTVILMLPITVIVNHDFNLFIPFVCWLSQSSPYPSQFITSESSILEHFFVFINYRSKWLSNLYLSCLLPCWPCFSLRLLAIKRLTQLRTVMSIVMFRSSILCQWFLWIILVQLARHLVNGPRLSFHVVAKEKVAGQTLVVNVKRWRWRTHYKSLGHGRKEHKTSLIK